MKKIREIALNLLARREHSALELQRKLSVKGFQAADIEIVLAQLKTEKLLNEPRFVENFIHFRRNKGFGPIRIRAELLERGISHEMIEPALNITDNAWFTEARKIWQKKFRGVKPTDFNTRAKQMRFLQYRGFTLEQLESVFEKFSDE